MYGLVVLNLWSPFRLRNLKILKRVPVCPYSSWPHLVVRSFELYKVSDDSSNCFRLTRFYGVTKFLTSFLFIKCENYTRDPLKISVTLDLMDRSTRDFCENRKYLILKNPRNWPCLSVTPMFSTDVLRWVGVSLLQPRFQTLPHLNSWSLFTCTLTYTYT